MFRLKKYLKNVIPDFLIRVFSGVFYGWHGDYSTWNEANEKCTGYDSQLIINKVKYSLERVRDGKCAYERDSVIFNEVQYSYPLLSSLMWIAAKNKGELKLLDFGGSLGSSYFQNKRFLDSLNNVQWNIVEQPGFVKEGLAYFSDEKLNFYYSINDCLNSTKIDIILFSSVLQYIEKPYELLELIKSSKINYIIIDRTPFIKGNERLTIQKVHPSIYKAKYPCWFFNEEKFLNNITPDYNLVFDFDALDKANIVSRFKGFLFERKV